MLTVQDIKRKLMSLNEISRKELQDTNCRLLMIDGYYTVYLPNGQTFQFKGKQDQEDQDKILIISRII